MSSPFIKKMTVTKKQVKRIKPKYRYYIIGTYGSSTSPSTMSTVIHDKENDSYYIYRNNRIIKQVSLEEIKKYSYGDGYTIQYKLYSKKDYRPCEHKDGKFIEVK